MASSNAGRAEPTLAAGVDSPRLAWATDVHLNFLSPEQIDRFCQALIADRPQAILLSGDISEAPSLERHLAKLAELVARPIYFVLGNHDFYRGGIERVRAGMTALGERLTTLHYLTRQVFLPLDSRTAIVGHDGWADGRAGNWEGSEVMLNDYLLIDELITADKEDRRARLQRLGDEAAAHLSRVLPLALERFERVIVLTHVPPFARACWHQGRVSDPDWLPHFTCVATGEVIEQAARAHPERQLVVLCGHTHSAGVARILPNLVVHTGGADYGAPTVQPPFAFPEP